MRTRITIAIMFIAAALALSGCAGDDSNPKGGEAFNDADVAFAQGMIQHHQQAIEMSQLADGRASSPEVKQLAADIEAAQDPEIQTMTSWLEAWGEDVPAPDGGMEGMDQGNMSDGMSGMMTDDQMNELRAASGAEFDQMFLTMMMEHHQGAIEMAGTERADGENPDAVALAVKIEADQKAEIANMQDLLGS